jgi:hypothetical protein
MQALSASFVVLIFFLPPSVEPVRKVFSAENKVSTGNNSCQNNSSTAGRIGEHCLEIQ